jgi:NAD(P)-dependent dehydrogenase (short-subunit alcohol dehydrogenase family)
MEREVTKSVLITGTSSGFGKTTAQYFLNQGWNVVATMRQPDPGLFNAPEKRLRVLRLDVTDLTSLNKAVADGIAAFGGIDVLVNNAGTSLMSAVEATPDLLMQEIFQTNTFGVMAMCRAIIPHMRGRGEGVIVNVSSSTATAPMPFFAIYSASKCAVEGFSEALAYELGLFGVKVRLVAPGMAPTTNLKAKAFGRKGMTPPPYEGFIQAFMTKMQNYPTNCTTEEETAEAIFSAATDAGDRLRYLAGPDTKFLYNLRRTTSEADYLAKIHEMFVPTAGP